MSVVKTVWDFVIRPWAWTTVRDTGITVYQVHADGRRRVWQRGGYRVPPVGPSPIPRRSA